MLKKLAAVAILPVYVWLFTELIDIGAAVAEALFGIVYDPAVWSTQAETYIYQPVYALSQLPVIGTMVDILWFVALFEMSYLIVTLLFRILEWANISGRSVIEA